MMQTDFLKYLPVAPWVYLFKDKKDQVLYIGKAKNLKSRVSQYFTPGSVWKQEMMQLAYKVDFIMVQNESESLYLESNLIKQYLPPFNNMLKGANAYAYIKLTKHPIPQLFITRKKINDGALYIGPKHNTRELKKFLQYLRQILNYRTCSLSQFKQQKLCSDYYFWLCKGRCAYSELPPPEYPRLIADFFKGNTVPIEKEIKRLLQEAVEVQNFEWAAKLRDIYLQIEQFTEKQSVEYVKNISGYLLQIREVGTWRVYVLLHFFEGKLVDVVRHHFDQNDMDEEAMLVSFSSEFWTFIQQGAYYATFSLPFMQKEKANMQALFDHFFESYLLSKSLQGAPVMNLLLKQIQERYELDFFPYRIECLDISHLSGAWTSGGLSVMVWGLLEKKYYRKYKIQTVNNDDYSSLKEVLIRRFWLVSGSVEQELLPDLFILDGGKGQLSILDTLLEEYPNFSLLLSKVQFVSLWKGEARKKNCIWYQSKKSEGRVAEKLYVWGKWQVVNYVLEYDEADRLLVKLRDEAHRFANFYRKQQASLEFKKA